MNRINKEPQDDLDRIFARMQGVEPPIDLKQRILMNLPTAPVGEVTAASIPQVRRRIAFTPKVQGIVAGTFGLLFLILAVRFGTQLDATGSLDLLANIFANSAAIAETQTEAWYLLSFSFPWIEMILMSILFLAFCIAFLLPSDLRISDQQQSI
jgi:hypothetical protein